MPNVTPPPAKPLYPLLAMQGLNDADQLQLLELIDPDWRDHWSHLNWEMGIEFYKDEITIDLIREAKGEI